MHTRSHRVPPQVNYNYASTVFINKLREHHLQATKAVSQDVIVPFDEDVRRLLQECKIGRGNAALLSEALAFAQPKDLTEKDIIKVRYS